MIKTKRIVAFMIATLMLMSNFMGLLGNISLAIQENVTVEFSVENDGSAHLSEDGKTLIYECEDHSSYDFQIGQFVNDEFVPIVLIKHGDPENGDKYIATGITSNQNLKIYCPNYNGGLINIFYGGNAINMFPEDPDNQQYFYSFQLEQIGDVNNYQFRIQEIHNSGGGSGQDLSNADFTIDFGSASWVVGDTTVTATINGNSITTNPVNLKGNTEITLSNYNPTTMDVRITEQGVENPFGTTLRVSELGVTRIMDHNAGNLPNGPFTFVVEEHHEPGGQGDPQIDIPNTEFSVDFGEASWEIRNQTTTATVEGKNLTNGRVDIRGDEVIRLSNWDSNLMQASIMVIDPAEDEDRWFRTRLNVNENGETRIMDLQANNMPHPEDSYIEFYVERYQGEKPENNLPPANTTATVTVTGGENCVVPYINARLAINGYGIWLDDPEQNPELGDEIPAVTTINDFGYCYNEAEDNGKVTISIGAIFIYKYVGTVSVNGQSFNVTDFIDYSDRTDWLDHYSGQMVGFNVEVNKADNYNIVVNLDEMEGHYIAIGNFLWTDEPAQAESDLYIGNSTLEVVNVTYEYDGHEVYVEEQDLFNDPHIEYNPYGEVGSLVVPEGAICTMRITPDYGYQVTSFGVNGGEIVTGDAISEFQFPIHKGNFHLMAQVTPVDDVVDSATDKVKGGTISIGNDEINSGTVILSVDDANLTDAKVERFEEEAGDYTINSYLDISLDQVFYKGTSENVWANEIHNLNNDATIELELEEDLDDKNIIIIHNHTDGDQESYNIIEIDSYDPETNTVTFKTDSFSNYAIAVKDNPNNTEDPTEPENPNEPVNPQDPVEPQDPSNPQDPVDPNNPVDPQDPNEPENPEEPAVAQKQYTIEKGDFLVVFSDDEGHEFELSVMELMNLTPEELAKMDLTEEEYEQAKKEVTEALKEYGTTLNVYEIQIFDEEDNYSHLGEVTIKIRKTQEMAQYNSFKLICIDDEDIEKEDIVNLEEDEDGNLVGNLFHLSNYALVAKNVETQTNNGTAATTPEEPTTTTNTEPKTNNPKTGDNIMFFVTMLVVSVIGMRVTIKSKK